VIGRVGSPVEHRPASATSELRQPGTEVGCAVVLGDWFPGRNFAQAATPSLLVRANCWRAWTAPSSAKAGEAARRQQADADLRRAGKQGSIKPHGHRGSGQFASPWRRTSSFVGDHHHGHLIMQFIEDWPASWVVVDSRAQLGSSASSKAG